MKKPQKDPASWPNDIYEVFKEVGIRQVAYVPDAAGPDALPLAPLPVDLGKTAENLMQQLIKTHLPKGLSCVPKVTVGRPFVEIIRYAEEKSVNLIVLGTHGRGAIVHALMGSTAERVVRKAPCPVLTVRVMQEKAKKAASTEPMGLALA